MFFNKNNESVSVNPYYMGDGCFNFPGLYESFSLRIIGEIRINGFSDLYACNLCYSCHASSNGKFGENIYYKLVVGFNIDRMINDSKYTRFLFDRIINRKNLMKIIDFNYDFIDRNMNINYIGSVLEINGNLVVYDDDNIRNIVNISCNRSIRKNDINSEKRERAFMSSVNRQEKFLRKKLEKMSVNYQKDINK